MGTNSNNDNKNDNVITFLRTEEITKCHLCNTVISSLAAGVLESYCGQSPKTVESRIYKQRYNVAFKSESLSMYT